MALDDIKKLPKKRKQAKIKKAFLSFKKGERRKVKHLNNLLKGSINSTIEITKSNEFNSQQKLRVDILALCDRKVHRGDKMWA